MKIVEMSMKTCQCMLQKGQIESCRDPRLQNILVDTRAIKCMGYLDICSHGFILLVEVGPFVGLSLVVVCLLEVSF